MLSLLLAVVVQVTPPPPFTVRPPSGWSAAPERGTPNHQYWVKDLLQKYPAFSVYAGPGTTQSSESVASRMTKPLLNTGAHQIGAIKGRACGLPAYEVWTSYRSAKTSWVMVSMYVATRKALYVGTYVRNLSDAQDPAVLAALASICPAKM